MVGELFMENWRANEGWVFSGCKELAVCKTLASQERTVKGFVFASRQASEGGDAVPATVLAARNHVLVVEEEGLIEFRP